MCLMIVLAVVDVNLLNFILPEILLCPQCMGKKQSQIVK